MKKKHGEKSPTKGARIITLKELGPQLPLGVLGPDGSQVRDIELKTWNFKAERKLSRTMENVEGTADPATYVTYVLSELCPSLGMIGHSSNEAKKVTPGMVRTMVESMYMGDVWYAYVWLRREAVGNEMTLTPLCKTCRKEFSFVANLDTIEVRVGDQVEDFYWEYKMKRPFSVRGKEVETITMGPPRWSVCQKMIENPTDASVAFETTKAGIYYLNGDHSRRAVVLDSDLDEMHKVDITGIASASNGKHLGANMLLEISKEEHTCSAGHRNDYTMAIDWSYQSFFADSSK